MYYLSFVNNNILKQHKNNKLMLKIIALFILIITFFFLSKGFFRWAWYYGIKDPQNNITPTIDNLLWYILKYDL